MTFFFFFPPQLDSKRHVIGCYFLDECRRSLRAETGGTCREYERGRFWSGFSAASSPGASRAPNHANGRLRCRRFPSNVLSSMPKPIDDRPPPRKIVNICQLLVKLHYESYSKILFNHVTRSGIPLWRNCKFSLVKLYSKISKGDLRSQLLWITREQCPKWNPRKIVDYNRLLVKLKQIEAFKKYSSSHVSNYLEY